MPVWVVIPLLWALVATPLAVVVLPGESGTITIQPPLCGEQAHVSGPGATAEEVVVVLVHPKLQVVVTIVSLTVGWTVRNGTAQRTTSKYI